MTSGLSYIYADLPQTITWRSNAYSCAVTDVEGSHDLMNEGFDGLYNFYFSVKIADFANGLPVLNDQFTYNSKDYRITKITKCADSISLNIYAVGLTK